MAQYKIENKVNKEYTKDGITKHYVSADLIGEDGTRYEKVGAFKGEFAADTWHGELTKNDKGYWNLVTPKMQSGNNFKSATIEKAMDKKADQIAKAQDRSAWMHAKNNASELLAAKEGHLVGKTIQNIASDVILLATLILNGEPTEPFTTMPLNGATKPVQRGYADEAGTPLSTHPFATEDDLKGLEEMF